MEIPDLEVESIAEGSWVSWTSLKELIPSMAQSYQRRLRQYHIGDAQDLAQSAELALLVYEKENGVPERIRELKGIGLIHRAMVNEVRSNRRQSSGGRGMEWLTERPQLTPKQIEMLQLFVNVGSKAAKKPLWECLWLKKVLGWSDLAISEYLRRKKDERAYHSPESVAKMVKLAHSRIKRKLSPDVVLDIRLLQFYV